MSTDEELAMLVALKSLSLLAADLVAYVATDPCWSGDTNLDTARAHRKAELLRLAAEVLADVERGGK